MSIVLLLASCQGFVIQEHIVDKYYLQATDIGEQLCLAYCPDGNGCFPIIPETVFAAGYNEKYIIVKQHPNNNRSITNYFILTFAEAKERAGKDCLFIPLTLEEFEKQQKLLHLENVKFTTVFKELE